MGAVLSSQVRQLQMSDLEPGDIAVITENIGAAHYKDIVVLIVEGDRAFGLNDAAATWSGISNNPLEVRKLQPGETLTIT